MTINCRGKLIELSEPKIAGILNITPDSFYDGGKYFSENSVKNRIKQLVKEGADIIDIGAFSSRPGAELISEKEEQKRLRFALDIIRKLYPDIILSVDTYRSEIAKFAVNNFNVDIINDISAGNFDAEMFDTIAKLNVPYIIMHMQGTPGNMQKKPQYKDVVKDLLKYFSEKIERAKKTGINDLIIDPGFGFGKTIEHNYQILSKMELFQLAERPILVGLSRKSMIYTLNNETPDDALPGTLALNMIALRKGANILRVHDIKETRQVIEVYKKMKIK
ncbi:MAG: dihydropteroate synthase [Bacteroidales bacterium]|nr:dihydropteroate synthase [Bacteroidales bacterium]